MFRIVFVVTVVLANWFRIGLTQENTLKDDPKHKVARRFVDQISAGNFDKAVESFDPTMTRVMPAAKLEEAWKGLEKQNGKFKAVLGSHAEKVSKYEIIYVTCEFEQNSIDVKVVLASDNSVAGLFFVPVYRVPEYVDPAKFDENEMEFGSAGWRLPGTLSVPKGDGPFAAVILVHGSGPNDRDETIGPNKTFRDLAQGLASRGIAVLRYEKRTRHHALKMAQVAKTLTVKEETIEDAAAAVEALKLQSKVDPARIFILGHSLGGMVFPRLGTSQTGIAGFISLAGSTRPLEDLVLEQTRYILALEGKPSPQAEGVLKILERQVAKVKSNELNLETPAVELPLGIPASYWLDLRDYDPALTATEIRQPMLFLQGERDYQVTLVDFERWKKELQSRQDVTFMTYPKLNHLFVEGEGKSTPGEYSIPGHVSKLVIDDIAKWIQQNHR